MRLLPYVILIFLFACALNPFHVDPLPDGVEPVRVYVYPNFENDWDGYTWHAARWWNRVSGCAIFEMTDDPVEADVVLSYGYCFGKTACYYSTHGVIMVDRDRFYGAEIDAIPPLRSWTADSIHEKRSRSTHQYPFVHARILVHELGHALGLDHIESSNIMHPRVDKQWLTVNGRHLSYVRNSFCSP